MVVVPAFAEAQERDPPVVGRAVAGAERLIANRMRCAVDQPGAVIREHEAREKSPDDERPATDQIEHDAERKAQYEMIALEGPVGRILEQVGHPARPLALLDAVFVRTEQPLYV